jgi:hypothetical protein
VGGVLASRVKGDIRLIECRLFASNYSVRFPRCVHIRYDKPWHDALTHGDLCGIATEASGFLKTQSPEEKKRKVAVR